MFGISLLACISSKGMCIYLKQLSGKGVINQEESYPMELVG
jgi:hypothetical protein